MDSNECPLFRFSRVLGAISQGSDLGNTTVTDGIILPISFRIRVSFCGIAEGSGVSMITSLVPGIRFETGEGADIVRPNGWVAREVWISWCLGSGVEMFSLSDNASLLCLSIKVALLKSCSSSDSLSR